MLGSETSEIGAQQFSDDRAIWFKILIWNYLMFASKTEFAERRCSNAGKWEGKPGGNPSSNGWTNYTNCYLPEVLELLKKLGNKDESEVNMWSSWWLERMLRRMVTEDFSGKSLSTLQAFLINVESSAFELQKSSNQAEGWNALTLSSLCANKKLFGMH